MWVWRVIVFSIFSKLLLAHRAIVLTVLTHRNEQKNNNNERRVEVYDQRIVYCVCRRHELRLCEMKLLPPHVYHCYGKVSWVFIIIFVGVVVWWVGYGEINRRSRKSNICTPIFRCQYHRQRQWTINRSLFSVNGFLFLSCHIRFEITCESFFRAYLSNQTYTMRVFLISTQQPFSPINPSFHFGYLSRVKTIQI